MSETTIEEVRRGVGWLALRSGWPSTVYALPRRGLTYSGERVRRLLVGRAA